LVVSEEPKTRIVPINKRISPNGIGRKKTGKPIIQKTTPTLNRIGQGMELIIQHNRMLRILLHQHLLERLILR
jgi:hypothetical protein